MNNYNRQIRTIITNSINNICNYYYLSIDNAILVYTQYLYEIFDYNSKICKILKTLISETIYADAYKVYNYKHKKLVTNKQDIFNYNEIANIVDYDDLMATISADPVFFSQLLKASYEFNETNGLTKVIMTKSLSNDDNERLLSIAPLHELDLKAYDKKITLLDIINNYKNQNRLYNELDINFEQARIEAVYGFIKELSLLDIDNTKDILRKIAKIDNKISLYLKDKVIDDSVINNHINIYSKDEDTILKELLYNKDFLIDAIWMVIDSCINHNYNEIKIDESLTNDILKLKRN